MSDKYFGLFCEQCNVWVRRDDKTLLFYPSAELAQAELETDDVFPFGRRSSHLWAVTEFGKQQAVRAEELPAGSSVCPHSFSREPVYA